MKSIVLNILENSNIPLTKDDLAARLSLSERIVRACIEELRRDKKPIINLGKGYFIARTPEEFKEGIEKYKSPFKAQYETLNAMETKYSEWSSWKQGKLF